MRRSPPRRRATCARCARRSSRSPCASPRSASRPEQRDALQELARQLEPLDDQADERAIDVHRRFHALIWEAAHNPLLAATLDLLWDRADRYRRQSLEALRGSGARRTADFEQHFELVELVLAGDGERAAELMHRHVEHSLPALVAASPEGAAGPGERVADRRSA